MGSVFRQSSVILASNFLLMAGGYLFKIFLARTVGAEGIGLFTLAESLLAFLLIAVTWQFADAVLRFNAQFRARGETQRMRRLIWASVWHVLVLGGVVGLALALTRSFWAETLFHAPLLGGVLIVFAVMLPARALETVVRMISRSYREIVRVVTITTLIAFPLKVLLSIVLIMFGMGLGGWLIGETVAAYLSAGLLLALGLYLSPPPARQPEWTLKQEPVVYGFAATMVGRSILSIANGRLGTLLLGVFLTPTDVGVYGVALTTVTLVGTLQSALNGAFAPHISELNAKGEMQELARLFYRVTRWDLMGVLPVGILLIVFSEQVMGVFGDKFANGAIVLAILVCGELVNVGTGPVGTLLTMGGKEGVVLKALVAQFVVNIGLMIALLPPYGLLGAALAVSISTIVQYTILYVIAKRYFPVSLYDGAMLKLLGMGLGVGALMLGLKVLAAPILGMGFALLVVAGTALAGIWLGALFLGIMNEEDKAMLKEALETTRARFGWMVRAR